ncbi:MAG TPA: ClpXP protease specificity-enhancing factor SspB [Xanthobacteraceae bacterium]|nr:ClpXP protease specificity-enhancing factor SspB [Xanthobacteraceae bacterium]
MAVDHIRYDLLVREALRGVVRRVVADVAKNGLPGDHHFFISFDTGAPGVRLSPRLRSQYPEEMTIVLQHQFWDLAVTDSGIEVGLSFGGIPEKLTVPFEAIKGFFDPSVQFGLEFEVATETAAEEIADADAPRLPAPVERERRPPRPRNTRERQARAGGDVEMRPVNNDSGTPAAPSADEPPRPDGGAEVVRLDRFRKK